MKQKHLLLQKISAVVAVVILSVLMLNQAGLANSIDHPNLKAQPLVTEKSGTSISPSVRGFLQQRSDRTAIVWVMFTDKSVRTEPEFELAATNVVINEHALKRRAKVNADQVLFADLPVVSEYVQQVIRLGGKKRTLSRWLNGASFEIPYDKMNEVSELPFVASIRPVSYFTSIYQNETDSKNVPDATALGTEDLNYGASVNQLTQIGVDKAHAAGYNGSGVVLAILDTGFRKSHEAFANAYAEGRVLDEYDFIFDDANVANEPEDASSQMSHGTSVWGTAGGEKDGTLYGPAYKASFLLAKTEDVRSETPIEEDYWVAAMEWSDSLGADVITTSLGYSDWYNYADFDGETAVITIAANTAIGLGIVVVNSAGNGGPFPGTITAPADAFEIISCGAVDVFGTIASFSSRGPTADGRIKPEVCARGASTYVSTYYSDSSYGPRNGTSFSAPLVAGAVCLLIQARPNFTPQMIRQALLETADNALTPNNTYGWGIINVDSAIKWGVNFAADETHGEPPHTVQFTDNSIPSPSSWHWLFGDGNESFDQSPLHIYDTAGLFDVSLTVMTTWGEQTVVHEDLIVVSADTLIFGSDSAFAGQTLISSVALSNSIPLDELEITFRTDSLPLNITLDSLKLGSRTTGFESLVTTYFGAPKNSWSARLIADNGGGADPLPAGSGEILKLYYSTDEWDDDQLSAVVDTSLAQSPVTNLKAGSARLFPSVVTGELRTRDIVRGDLNNDGRRNLADITRLIAYVYLNGVSPVALPAGDCIIDQRLNLADITNLIAFVYINGDDPDL